MRLIDQLIQSGMSRGEARRALMAGKVRLQGTPTADPGRELEPGAELQVDLQAPRLAPGRDLVVLRRLGGLVVVWKPAGMLSVPAPREGGQKNALALVRRWFGSGLPVHRLDEETSGLLMVALDEPTQLAMKALLERHEVRREYLALVAQPFPRGAFRVESELVRDRGDGLRGSRILPRGPGRGPRPRRLEPPPQQEGKLAITHVELVENLARDAALVRARLETGRTHQVRIHLAEIGHPVLGDPLYAPRAIQVRAPRLALHAAALAFTHPTTGEAVELRSPLADDLEVLRRELGRREPAAARPRSR